jgi:two-component system, NtrC family, sensor kinase
MRLGRRTTVAMLIVAGVPLMLAGWTSIRLSQESLRTRTGDLHRTVAKQMASSVGDTVRASVRALKLAAAAFRFDTLNAEERRGVLRLVFRQTQAASAVVLLDAEGKQAAPAVYLGQRATDPALADRPPLTDADVDRLAANIPFSAARQVGAAVGPIYMASDGTPRIALAALTEEKLVLAVELSLPALLAGIGNPRLGGRGRYFVVDREGRVVLDEVRAAVTAREDRSRWPVLAAARGGDAAGRFTDPVLGDAIGAAAQDLDLGWTVMVAEPAADALAGARALLGRALLLLAVALLAAALLGVLSSRAVVKPIKALHAGAAAVQAGDVSHRVAGAGRADELGDLARAFNSMAEEVERWRRELEGRVEEKTRELREAQELLLRAQNLAALGQLGAGVAHEINNPLAGLLGMTQIMLEKAPVGSTERTRLESVEKQALRIHDIVENLRRLAEGGEGITFVATDVHQTVEAALVLDKERLAAEKIAVVREFGAQVPPVAGEAAQLSEAFLQLVTNARRAMSGGGTLTISTRLVEGKLVYVRFADTGEGIPAELQQRIFEPFFTTKKEWQAKGLGLTLANRIVELHRGRITVESTPGKGAAFTVALPVMQQRTLA